MGSWGWYSKGLGRWFAKWAARRGNFGGTARTIGNQYRIMRGSDTDTPRPEILKQIVELRYAILPYRSVQKARLCSAAAGGPTLTDFVMEIVLAEVNTYQREIGDMAQISREVVREELEKLGMSEET